MIVNVSEGIDQLIQTMRDDQSEDGSWRYPLESGTFTDAYMIILLRTLERDDEALIRGLQTASLRSRNRTELGSSLRTTIRGM